MTICGQLDLFRSDETDRSATTGAVTTSENASEEAAVTPPVPVGVSQPSQIASTDFATVGDDGAERVDVATAKSRARIEKQSPRKRLLATTTPPGPYQRPTTLAACLDWLDSQPEVDPSLVKLIRGAVRTVAKVVGRDAAQLPTKPAELRPILNAAMPAALSLTHGRWRNCMTQLRTLLEAAGLINNNSWDKCHLTKEWAECLEKTPALSDSKFAIRIPLTAFARHCQAEDTQPEQVNGATFLRYAKRLANDTLTEHPELVAYSIARRWRRNQRLVPSWPQNAIELPSKAVQKFMPAARFLPSLQDDLARYLNNCRNPDPLDPDQGRPAAAISIEHYRRGLLRGATILVESGMPIETITGIDVLVTPQAYRKILERLFEDSKTSIAARDSGSQWSPSALQIARVLYMAAKRHVRPGEETIKELSRLCGMVKLRDGGLSKKNHLRLSQFGTSEERRALYALPERGFEQADRLLKKAKSPKDFLQAARLHETTLALAILFASSIRLGNLAELDLERHFQRDSLGRVAYLCIPASEVKNRKIVEADIAPKLLSRLEIHIRKYRPLILGDRTSTALFLGRHGARPCRSSTLASRIAQLVVRQLGKRFNVHLARHLVPDVILDKHPEAMALVQRILNHASLTTTENKYGSRRTRAALRLFASALEADPKA